MIRDEMPNDPREPFEGRTVDERGEYNRYCWSNRHNTPCPHDAAGNPCRACTEECEREDYEDSAVNRQRTREWEVRRPK